MLPNVTLPGAAHVHVHVHGAHCECYQMSRCQVRHTCMFMYMVRIANATKCHAARCGTRACSCTWCALRMLPNATLPGAAHVHVHVHGAHCECYQMPRCQVRHTCMFMYMVRIANATKCHAARCGTRACSCTWCALRML